MASLYTLENIEESWNILMKSSSTAEMRNRADKFLIDFKNSEFLVEICSDLILNAKNESSTFLGAHFLYLFIQENINKIIESTEIYLKLKDLLLNKLIHQCDKLSLIIIKRICYSISNILVIGSLTINKDFIEEIIAFGKTSITNCYISIIILNSAYFEFSKLNINEQAIKLKIINKLQEKMQIVLEYLNFLLENFNLNQKNNNDINKTKFQNHLLNLHGKINIEEIEAEILDLIQSLIKLNVNILFNPNVFINLIDSINAKNAEKISFIIADCIKFLSSACLYVKLDTYDVNQLSSSIVEDHIKIIEGLVYFIDEFIKNKMDNNFIYNPKNFNLTNYSNNAENSDNINNGKTQKLDSDRIEILAALAYMFSAILENFVYLIFLDTNISQIIYSNFIYFLSCKNLRISEKMFKPLEEISFFLRESFFEDNPQNITLNKQKTCDQIKEEISLFLINVTGLIMFNCKFNNISIPVLSKERIITNIKHLQLEEENDWDSNDPKFLSVSDYRNHATEAFFDIFNVFVVNLRNEGVKTFLVYLNSVVDQNNLLNAYESNANSTEISEKEKREKVNMIEVILHLLGSIISLVIQQDEYVDLFLNLALKIFGTQVIYDENILCSFLILLNEIPDLVNKNKALFKSTLDLFALTMKNRQFQYISTDAIERISEYSNQPQEEIFNLFYKIYLDNFDIFEANSLSNLTLALTKFICPNNYFNFNNCDIIKYSEEQKLFFVELILNPVTSSLDKINEFISKPDISANFHSNKELVRQLKSTLAKNLKIYGHILSMNNLNIDVFEKIYFLFYNKIKNIFEFYIKFLSLDYNLEEAMLDIMRIIIKQINDLKQKNTLNTPELSLTFKDFLSIFTFIYNRNPSNICLNILNGLIENMILLSQEKEDNVFIANFVIINQKITEFFLNVQVANLREPIQPECIKFWILILKLRIAEILTKKINFDNIFNYLLRLLMEFNQKASVTEFSFETFDYLIYFFIEFFRVNFFPSEFIDDKLPKLIKVIIEMIPKTTDSKIAKLADLMTSMILLDNNSFARHMYSELNSHKNFSNLELIDKQKIIDIMIKKSNHTSAIEFLLISMKEYINGNSSMKLLDLISS